MSYQIAEIRERVADNLYTVIQDTMNLYCYDSHCNSCEMMKLKEGNTIGHCLITEMNHLRIELKGEI